MSNSMKDSWRETGSGLGRAFKDLGKTLINTGKTGVDKAVDWAETNDTQAPPPQYQQPPQQQYAQTQPQTQYTPQQQYQPPQPQQPNQQYAPPQQQYQQPQHQYIPPQQNPNSGTNGENK